MQNTFILSLRLSDSVIRSNLLQHEIKFFFKLNTVFHLKFSSFNSGLKKRTYAEVVRTGGGWWYLSLPIYRLVVLKLSLVA